MGFSAKYKDFFDYLMGSLYKDFVSVSIWAMGPKNNEQNGSKENILL